MRKKNQKVVLRLIYKEAKLAVRIMIEIRNMYLGLGKPTEDLDELILKLCKA